LHCNSFFNFRDERGQVDDMISLFVNMELPEYKYENKNEENKNTHHKTPFNYQAVITV